MKTVLKSVVLAAAVALSAQPVLAADAPKAKNLEELLQQVKKDRLSEGRINKQREQEFLSERADKQALLRKAKAELAAEKSRGEQLAADFAENEKTLSQLEEELTLAVGNLGEAFGIVRQVAGDLNSRFQNSIISAQFPGRETLMSELAQTKDLPELPQLEELWFALQQEATQSGKIVKFSAEVSTNEGEKVTQDVVRVGAFNLMNEDEYLVYSSDNQAITELGRQPEAHFVSSVKNYMGEGAGVHPLYVDPSRGTILSLLTTKTTLGEYYEAGGIVGYIITGVLLLGLLIVLERLLVLSAIGGKIRKQLKSDVADESNPLGRIIKVYENNRNVDVETLELKLDEAILKETPRIERGVSVIKILAAIAPLLGLLGTVTGMIATFQSITLFGTGDPRVMAGGISTALVTTVLGLVAALPLIFLHSIVYARSQALIHVVEEQSAGIIAAHAEKENK
ncbi:MotA/TolQ/ExbB proton channel family protein [Gallaecimonas sp. GXIMD4217]|uniref:MotA/TolQ/ExbB proton channel family protein n=1 Tax=Gallaecimonas sp. GXIMD4217 TaxID=3131927 RepID=UPI00311B27C8